MVLDAESGAVKSIFDKELNKELVNASSPYRFDQYLYVTGADRLPNRAVQYSPAAPVPEFSIHGAGSGRLVSVTQQPFGIVAHLESQGVNTPKIETEVILFNGQKKIEFINRVHKTEVYTKESVYFAFPFAMEHPQFRYEIQNGFVDPSRDQLPGAGKEWFSVQHWVAAEEGGVSAALVPVDASLGQPGRYLSRHLAEAIRPAPGNDFLLRDEQLLGHQLCRGTGRRFHLSLRADQRRSLAACRPEPPGVGRDDARGSRPDHLAG